MVRLLAVVLVLGLCGAAVSAQTAEVWLEPDTVYYQNNDLFYERVYVDENLVGAKIFHITLAFDHTVVNIPPSAVELGGLFSGLEEDTVTAFYRHLWADSNHLDIDIAYLTDSAVISGPGELLILPVVPKGFGQSGIVIEELLVFDRFNQEIPTVATGEVWTRICQFVGDVNADNSIDIRDIVYLVEYMFKNGPEPLPSVWSGNFNCDETSVDISDLVDMVSWAFLEGPWVCDPPCVEAP